MRIGIEAQRIFRPNKHGMDVVALETIRHLVKVAPEHTVVVFVRPDDDPCLDPAPNLEIHEVPGWSYPTWEQWSLPQAVREANVDLLHCTSNTAPVQIDVPLVLWLHDIIYLEDDRSLLGTGGTWYQRLGNAYRRLVVPQALKNAHAVVTVSEFERETIGEAFPEIEPRLTAIHNGLAEQFEPVAAPDTLRDVRDRYSLPEEYVLFLGNTAPKKNTPNVLDAYARYHADTANPHPLVIADYDRDRVRSHLRDRGHADVLDDVITPGYVAYEDMAALYTMASLFLYPSLRESFGMPIAESMACGTPVVTADAASMPEVAGDAAVCVDPTQPSAIASGMRRVLDHVDTWMTLRRRGLRRSRLFSWENTARRLLPLYEAVAQGQSVPATAQKAPSFLSGDGLSPITGDGTATTEMPEIRVRSSETLDRQAA
jgi:glycosyltransferase involved in cell wall biosynthesis